MLVCISAWKQDQTHGHFGTGHNGFVLFSETFPLPNKKERKKRNLALSSSSFKCVMWVICLNRKVSWVIILGIYIIFGVFRMTLFSYFQDVCLHLIYSPFYMHANVHTRAVNTHNVLKTAIKMCRNTCFSNRKSYHPVFRTLKYTPS